MHTSASVLPDAADLSTGGRWNGEVVDDRYRLRAPLGAGATSTVWLARDERLRRTVAVKELPRERQPTPGSGELEARTIARLVSRNIVKVYDFVADDRLATDWIVMEALSGCDLASVLRSEHHVDVDEARYIATHLVAALRDVHDAGLIHCDVKPSNVHLCRDGRVVLTDFGLAGVPRVTGNAWAGHIVGSLPYIAPEILTEGSYSSASDFYALGMTLYAAVTGAPLAGPADDVFAGRRPHAAPDLDALPGRAAALRPVLQGLLDPNPTTRFDARATESYLS